MISHTVQYQCSNHYNNPHVESYQSTRTQTDRNRRAHTSYVNSCISADTPTQQLCSDTHGQLQHHHPPNNTCSDIKLPSINQPSSKLVIALTCLISQRNATASGLCTQHCSTSPQSNAGRQNATPGLCSIARQRHMLSHVLL